MAYLIDLGGGGKITLKTAVVLIDNQKRKVGLGRVTAESGRKFCDRLDALQSVRELNGKPDADLAKWLSGLSHSIRDRLADIGLAEPREDRASLTLGGMLDEVFRSLTVRPQTRVIYLQTRSALESCFGKETPIKAIGSLDAERFRRALVDGKLAGATIS